MDTEPRVARAAERDTSGQRACHCESGILQLHRHNGDTRTHRIPRIESPAVIVVFCPSCDRTPITLSPARVDHTRKTDSADSQREFNLRHQFDRSSSSAATPVTAPLANAPRLHSSLRSARSLGRRTTLRRRSHEHRGATTRARRTPTSLQSVAHASRARTRP